MSGWRSRGGGARVAGLLASVALGAWALPPGPASAQVPTNTPSGTSRQPSLAAPAAPAQAGDVTLDNVALVFGEMSYRAPRVIVRGSSLSRADLLRILDTGSPEPAAARIARLEAAEIQAPEVVAELVTPQGRQRTTYRGVVFTKIQAGRIASITSSGGTIETVDRPAAMSGRFDRFGLQDLDLGRALAMFTAKASPGAPLQRIYGTFSLEGLSFSDGNGITSRIGRLSGQNLAAKPTTAGWMGTMAILAATPDLKAAPPDARRRTIEAMSELFDSFQLGSIEASDITFGQRDAQAGAGRVSRVAFTTAPDTGQGALTVEGLEGSATAGLVRIGSLAFGGLSMKPFIDGMRDMISSPTGEISPAGLRRMIPALGSITLAGLEVDPEAKGASVAAGRSATAISLGRFELVSAKPIEGLPSDMRMTLRNVVFPVPAEGGNDTMRQLASLGYGRVDASMSFNLGWNEPGQELVLREVSVEGADMGSAVLRAVVGGVGRDAFNPDSAVAAVSLMGAAAKSAEITLDNRGLFERFVAREAARQKRSPEDVRREYGTTAAFGIPAILGNSAGAKAIAQAVARFVAKPGRLTLRAKSKQPGGYGVADFTAGPNPAGVMNALDITATAE